MLGRRLLRIGVTLAPAGVGLFLAAPGHATTATAGELRVEGSFVCTVQPGWRSINFLIVSNLPEQGTVTAFSISPSTVTGTFTSVGSPIGGNATASAQVGAGPGPTSATMDITVRYPTSGAGGGPLDVSATRTVQLNPCLPRPRATLASLCNGTVRVTMYNGTSGDVTETGGHAKFEIFGAYGYHAGPYYVQPWYGPATDDVPANAASSVTITGEGVVVAQGGYVAAPGCVGYVPAQPTGGGGSGGGGSGGAGHGATPAATAGTAATAGATGPDAAGRGAAAYPTDAVVIDRQPTTGTTTGMVATGLAAGGAIGMLGAGISLLVWRHRIARGVGR